jgi:hypothetical protein
MLIRLYVSVTVVISAHSRRPRSARTARRAKAESLPPLQDTATNGFASTPTP